VGLGLVAAVVIAILASGRKDPAHAARAAPSLPKQVMVPPQVTLATLRGQSAVINFWASWCGPCRKEAPELARLSTELGGRGHLVGVDWSDNHTDATAFIKRYHWRFPVLEDHDGAVGNRYGISGLPTTFLLDRRGRIVRELRGPQTARDIERELAGIDGRRTTAKDVAPRLRATAASTVLRFLY
jgi:thiol-disulfide isomerase/thioredoxin